MVEERKRGGVEGGFTHRGWSVSDLPRDAKSLIALHAWCTPGNSISLNNDHGTVEIRL